MQGSDSWSAGGCPVMTSCISSLAFLVPSCVDGAPKVFFLGDEHGALAASFSFKLPCHILIDVFLFIVILQLRRVY